MIDGIDFFFALQQEGRKLVEFLMNAAPCRYFLAKKETKRFSIL
jgi:NMD protein affecting ribosome stability and mRNA decay